MDKNQTSLWQAEASLIYLGMQQQCQNFSIITRSRKQYMKAQILKGY